MSGGGLVGVEGCCGEAGRGGVGSGGVCGVLRVLLGFDLPAKNIPNMWLLGMTRELENSTMRKSSLVSFSRHGDAGA